MEGKEKLTNNKELSHLEFPHSPVAPGGSEREDLISQAQCSTSFQLLNVWVLTWVEVSSNSRRLCLFLPLSLSLWYCCLPPFWQQQAMGFGSFPLCPYSQGHWPLKYWMNTTQDKHWVLLNICGYAKFGAENVELQGWLFFNVCFS